MFEKKDDRLEVNEKVSDSQELGRFFDLTPAEIRRRRTLAILQITAVLESAVKKFGFWPLFSKFL